jgi:hypothetical protein
MSPGTQEVLLLRRAHRLKSDQSKVHQRSINPATPEFARIAAEHFTPFSNQIPPVKPQTGTATFPLPETNLPKKVLGEFKALNGSS